MGGDPKGGRVCWPASGGGGMSSTFRLERQVVRGRVSESADSPFSAASTELVDFNGWEQLYHKFENGTDDAAAYMFAVPPWYDGTSSARLWFHSWMTNSPNNLDFTAHGKAIAPNGALAVAFSTQTFNVSWTADSALTVTEISTIPDVANLTAQGIYELVIERDTTAVGAIWSDCCIMEFSRP